jgi:hypothetical protein
MMPCTSNETLLPLRPRSGAEEWSVGLVSHGVPFRLSAKSNVLLELMRQQAPFGSMECPVLHPEARTFALQCKGAQARYQVAMDDEVLASDEALSSALLELGGHLMIHVAEFAPDYVFLHAGVVAWQNRALLLPGVSHAGKSTLVAELVRAGATYYSDEFALLDTRGMVHPFSRELRMRQSGREEQVPVALAQLKGRAGAGALPVAMVVFTEFTEQARWAPEPMTPGRAVLEMLLHATPVQRTPRRVMATLSATMRHATAWRSQRGEAHEVARLLLAALATGKAPL